VCQKSEMASFGEPFDLAERLGGTFGQPPEGRPIEGAPMIQLDRGPDFALAVPPINLPHAPTVFAPPDLGGSISPYHDG
jgi:hypothetical protein